MPEFRTIGGVPDVEVDLSTKKATPAGIRRYFGDPVISAKELMALKKDDDGNLIKGDSSNYNQIARGLFDGTLTC
jgi:hypothetical protein